MIQRMFYSFLILLMISSIESVQAREMEMVWQSYLSINTRISALQHTQDQYSREQEILKSKISQLQNSSYWYNAWINKFLLSNHSDRQLAVLDSLQNIESQLSILKGQQTEVLEELKIVYEQVLVSYGDGDSIPVAQRATSLRVVQVLMNQSAHEIQLPDYRELVESEYANQELRDLVLTDVRELLALKIVQLDSILSIRAKEIELAARLAEFHEDLGLQMESEQDVQQRDSRGETEKSFAAWGAAEALSDVGGNENPRDDASISGRFAESVESISLNVRREGIQTLSAINLSPNDIDYLKSKQNEYEALLSLVNKELDHTP